MTRNLLSVLVIAGILGACGSNGFNGGTAEKSSSDAQANIASGGGGGKSSTGDGSNPGSTVGIPVVEPGGDNPADVTGGSVDVGEASLDEREAIEACSVAWGQDVPVNFDSVRKIKSNVSILGGSTLVDNRRTEGPEMTLVLASVNVLSKLDWKLLNPNGWYCIVANVNVLSSMTVTIHENGHLADSQVAVDVLSRTDGGIAASNVNVLSSVKVIRQGDEDVVVDEGEENKVDE